MEENAFALQSTTAVLQPELPTVEDPHLDFAVYAPVHELSFFFQTSEFPINIRLSAL